jgi:cytochrome c biogenesis protein CcdA
MGLTVGAAVVPVNRGQLGVVVTQAAVPLGMNLEGLLRPTTLCGPGGPCQRFQGGSFGATRPERKGVLAGPILGAVVAIGWSPCIGPPLGAILTVSPWVPDPRSRSS